nr:PI-PLC X domain-containing protein At5g67130-like [Ipomoea batatas]
MGFHEILDLVLIVSVLSFNVVTSACSGENCQVLEECSDCGAGMFCLSCPLGFSGAKCVRSTATDQFKLLNNSLPFNKYAFLTTHNAFSITGWSSRTGVPNVAPKNQEDSITQQLNNGVRGLMLDVYDFRGDVWLCHSFGGKCYDFTAFVCHTSELLCLIERCVLSELKFLNVFICLVIIRSLQGTR